jgi:hypothetical protein
VVGGWFSLRYGWGIEVQRWWVLATYGLSLAFGLMFAQLWVMRGRDTRNAGGEGGGVMSLQDYAKAEATRT